MKRLRTADRPAGAVLQVGYRSVGERGYQAAERQRGQRRSATATLLADHEVRASVRPGTQVQDASRNTSPADWWTNGTQCRSPREPHGPDGRAPPPSGRGALGDWEADARSGGARTAGSLYDLIFHPMNGNASSDDEGPDGAGHRTERLNELLDEAYPIAQTSNASSTPRRGPEYAEPT